jgi:hypothetical protein
MVGRRLPRADPTAAARLSTNDWTTLSVAAGGITPQWDAFIKGAKDGEFDRP